MKDYYFYDNIEELIDTLTNNYELKNNKKDLWINDKIVCYKNNHCYRFWYSKCIYNYFFSDFFIPYCFITRFIP
jgi:hypothetical protein